MCGGKFTATCTCVGITEHFHFRCLNFVNIFSFFLPKISLHKFHLCLIVVLCFSSSMFVDNDVFW